MSQVLKIMYKQIVPVLFQCSLKVLELRFHSYFESNFAV